MATQLGRRLPVVIAIAAVVLLCVGLVATWRTRRAVRAFRAAHGADRDLLLVYTDSPHWAPYIAEQWLPRWGSRSVVLDRSRPWTAEQPEVQLWRALAGRQEHTPVAIVVPPRGMPKIVRFFKAFRDFKHGHPEALRAAEGRLDALLTRRDETRGAEQGR